MLDQCHDNMHNDLRIRSLVDVGNEIVLGSIGALLYYLTDDNIIQRNTISHKAVISRILPIKNSTLAVDEQTRNDLQIFNMDQHPVCNCIIQLCTRIQQVL